MGTCSYCGKKAGFLKKAHKECEKKYQEGRFKYIELVRTGIVDNKDFEELEKEIKDLKETAFINDIHIPELNVRGFDKALLDFLEDGVLSVEEEERICGFMDHFNLGQSDLDKHGSYMKMSMAIVLRELTEGRIPEMEIKVDGQLPFLFQKSESLIWLFNQVEFYEQRTRTEFRGGSQGVSVRVAKGVYYRAGAFKGKPVKYEEMKHIGNGILALTTKHIYFSYPNKSFKIPFNKIIALEPYENGIGVQKDGVTAKPQVFKNLDGWFAHNAISNLSQL